MKSFICWLAVTLTLSAVAEITAIQTNTLVFLNTGISPKEKGISDDEAGKMQAQHVGNFGTQFNLGKLMAAGPVGRGGKTRGIVVLAVHTPQQIAECFMPDPYVQTGIVNGGIQLRSQRAKEPAFEMVGYQADMGEGYWGSLYDESRRRKTLALT